MTGADAARTRGSRRAAVLAGLAAAALLLGSPWAAGAEPTGVPRDAGSCRQDELPPADAMMAEVLERRRAEAGAPGEAGELVVLNNRGYNYGPPPGIDLDQILAERIRPGSGTR